jgi:hypothetical protein
MGKYASNQFRRQGRLLAWGGKARPWHHATVCTHGFEIGFRTVQNLGDDGLRSTPPFFLIRGKLSSRSSFRLHPTLAMKDFCPSAQN